MMSERPKRPERRRKMGRGLSEISHIFLSGAERNLRQAPDSTGDALWLSDASLISITSGEKIQGKTLLTANLAFGLFTEGKSVAVVNVDSEKPDILDMMSAVPAGGGDGIAISSPRFGGLPVADIYGGFDPVASGGESGPASPMAAIETAAGRAQIVVIDTSPWAEPSRSVWTVAGLTLVVVRAGSDAMRASYLTVKRVRSMSPAGRIGLVVNMASSRAEAYKCFRKMSEVCRRFLKTNIRNYGYILHSDIAGDACKSAVPLAQAYPESAVTKCIHSILKLIVMDESAIARRRREVTVKTCALREGR